MTPLRMALGGAAALVLILVIGIVLYNFDPFGRRKNAEQRAENATAQAATSEVVAKATDTHHTETIVIRERADRAIQTVERAPGADDPVPAAVLDALLVGLQHGAGGSPQDERTSELSR